MAVNGYISTLFDGDIFLLRRPDPYDLRLNDRTTFVSGGRRWFLPKPLSMAKSSHPFATRQLWQRKTKLVNRGATCVHSFIDTHGPGWQVH